MLIGIIWCLVWQRLYVVVDPPALGHSDPLIEGYGARVVGGHVEDGLPQARVLGGGEDGSEEAAADALAGMVGVHAEQLDVGDLVRPAAGEREALALGDAAEVAVERVVAELALDPGVLGTGRVVGSGAERGLVDREEVVCVFVLERSQAGRLLVGGADVALEPVIAADDAEAVPLEQVASARRVGADALADPVLAALSGAFVGPLEDPGAGALAFALRVDHRQQVAGAEVRVRDDRRAVVLDDEAVLGQV